MICLNYKLSIHQKKNHVQGYPSWFFLFPDLVLQPCANSEAELPSRRAGQQGYFAKKKEVFPTGFEPTTFSVLVSRGILPKKRSVPDGIRTHDLSRSGQQGYFAQKKEVFPTGFEPTTFRLGGERSILLSYGNTTLSILA